jgi:hypothetical protein
MGRKDRKIDRKADEKEISKLTKIETVPKHGVDEKSSMPSEPRKSPSRR